MKKNELRRTNSIIYLILLLGAACTNENPAIDNQVLTPIADNMKIGCFYYPWYGENRHWDDYLGQPVLGEYNSQSVEVMDQHLHWAINHGVDFFLMSWWGKNSYEDNSLERYFDEVEIPDYFKVGILYEAPHLLGRTNDGLIDFNETTVIQVLKDDFEYLANTYFSRDQYLKIDRKPVVYFYLTRIFTGDYVAKLAELRQYVSDLGFELYLIGDQVYWQSPNTDSERQLMKQFDAVSSYNMHASVPDIATNFVEKVSLSYAEWFEVAEANSIDFVPNVMPGYNDTAGRVGNPIIARNEADFQQFCKESLNYLSPQNMVLVTSWNEWHEYTSVEPDQTYNLSYLEIIKRELAGQR